MNQLNLNFEQRAIDNALQFCLEFEEPTNFLEYYKLTNEKQYNDYLKFRIFNRKNNYNQDLINISNRINNYQTRAQQKIEKVPDTNDWSKQNLKYILQTQNTQNNKSFQEENANQLQDIRNKAVTDNYGVDLKSDSKSNILRNSPKQIRQTQLYINQSNTQQSADNKCRLSRIKRNQSHGKERNITQASQVVNHGQNSLEPYMSTDDQNRNLIQNIVQNNYQIVNQLRKQPLEQAIENQGKNTKKQVCVSPYDSKWSSNILRIHYNFKLKEVPESHFHHHVHKKTKESDQNELQTMSHRQSHSNSTQKIRIKKILNQTTYNQQGNNISNLQNNLGKINQSFDIGQNYEKQNKSQLNNSNLLRHNNIVDKYIQENSFMAQSHNNNNNDLNILDNSNSGGKKSDSNKNTSKQNAMCSPLSKTQDQTNFEIEEENSVNTKQELDSDTIPEKSQLKPSSKSLKSQDQQNKENEEQKAQQDFVQKEEQREEQKGESIKEQIGQQKEQQANSEQEEYKEEFEEEEASQQLQQQEDLKPPENRYILCKTKGSNQQSPVQQEIQQTDSTYN